MILNNKVSHLTKAFKQQLTKTLSVESFEMFGLIWSTSTEPFNAPLNSDGWRNMFNNISSHFSFSPGCSLTSYSHFEMSKYKKGPWRRFLLQQNYYLISCQCFLHSTKGIAYVTSSRCSEPTMSVNMRPLLHVSLLKSVF